MNTPIAPVPDLLQRFVPTPHIFSLCRAGVHVHIETNDLEIALEVRKLCMQTSSGELQTVLLWKFIRDQMAPLDGAELTLLSEGPLRTLWLGTSTIITFDRERHEILGFLAPGVTAEQLVMTLIPLLINADVRDIVLPATP